jgi:hypothetical protein
MGGQKTDYFWLLPLIWGSVLTFIGLIVGLSFMMNSFYQEYINYFGKDPCGCLKSTKVNRGGSSRCSWGCCCKKHHQHHNQHNKVTAGGKDSKQTSEETKPFLIGLEKPGTIPVPGKLGPLKRNS